MSQGQRGRAALAPSEEGGIGLGKWLFAAGIFAATFLAFSRVLNNGFVDWDDPSTLVNNTAYRGLGSAQLRWMFSTFHWGHYQPLFWLSYAFDYLWCSRWYGEGLNAAGFHFTSLLLHCANAVLVYMLAIRVLAMEGVVAPQRSRRPIILGAALGALFFAIHPLRVEPVAWATGRGDLLVTFFLLVCVLSYMYAVRDGQSRVSSPWFFLSLISFAAALLSRASAVTAPFVLVLLDWHPLRRLGHRCGSGSGDSPRRVLLEKLPFLILAIPIAILAPLAKASTGGAMDLERHGAIERIAQGCYGLAFYLLKTFIPMHLSPIYELRPPIQVASPRYLSAVLVVLLVGGLMIGLLITRRARGVSVGILAYGLLVLPVLGFFQSGNQEVADRYSYLPSIPVSLLAAGCLSRLFAATRLPVLCRTGLGAAGGAALILLGLGSWRLCGIWRDTAVFWNYAASVAPESSIALNGRGWVLMQEGRYPEADVCLRRSVDLQPLNEKAHHNLWTLLKKQGRDGELIEAYNDSIRRYPRFFDAYYNLGNELLHRGLYEEAARQYRAALEIRPTSSEALTNLGWVLMQMGDWDQAIKEYVPAVEADPTNVRARHGLARLLDRQNRRPEAVQQLRAAVAADPTYEPARRLLEQWTSDSSGNPPAMAPSAGQASPLQP